MPDVPTVREAGYPALTVDGPYGFFGWRGISETLKQRIAADLQSVAGDAALSKRLRNVGFALDTGTPASFAEAIQGTAAPSRRACPSRRTASESSGGTLMYVFDNAAPQAPSRLSALAAIRRRHKVVSERARPASRSRLSRGWRRGWLNRHVARGTGGSGGICASHRHRSSTHQRRRDSQPHDRAPRHRQRPAAVADIRSRARSDWCSRI